MALDSGNPKDGLVCPSALFLAQNRSAVAIGLAMTDAPDSQGRMQRFPVYYSPRS